MRKMVVQTKLVALFMASFKPAYAAETPSRAARTLAHRRFPHGGRSAGDIGAAVFTDAATRRTA